MTTFARMLATVVAAITVVVAVSFAFNHIGAWIGLAATAAGIYGFYMLLKYLWFK